jgi:hypothetical protein
MDKQEAINQAWLELRYSIDPKSKLWPIIMKLKAAIDMNEGLEREQFSEPYRRIFASSEDKEDRVNHPQHYTWLKDLCGIEVIDITRHMDFNIGNAIKYILRHGHKSEKGMSNKEKAVEDLKKAVFYINYKIKMLEQL